MALDKQNLPVPLALGLDQKTDPWQVQPGKFLSLINWVFNKGGRLQKRNGFAKLTALPTGAAATTIDTFNDNLVAIGTSLYAFSQSDGQWLNKGRMQPVQLSVQPLVRTALSQTTVDSATSESGLTCAIFLDGDAVYKYQIVDTSTKQVIVPVSIIAAGANVPRVCILGNRFVITFLRTVAATPHLQYITIPLINLTAVTAPVDLSTQVSSTTTAGYDIYVANNTMYVAWNGSDGGGAIRLTRLSSTLAQGGTTVVSGFTSTLMSVTADISGSTAVIWASWWSGGNAFAAAFDQNLVLSLAPTQFLTAVTITELTSTADNGIVTEFYEVSNTYSFSAVRSDFIARKTVTSAGVVSSQSIVARSVGIVGKAFIHEDRSYLLASYSGSLQPTYFLIDSLGNVVAKLAYSNGGGYATTQVLSSPTLIGNVADYGYLLRTLITPVNKAQGSAVSAGVYSQMGLNLVAFDLSADKPLLLAEIGGSLHIGGGIVWQYDGIAPVELGFHLWPEDLLVTTSGAGGLITAQQYFYQVTYEWTDGAGNIHRSAPSIPFGIVTVGATSSNTLNIPTLRLTYKNNTNKIRIVIYRWSAAQQSYYQVTSVTSPLLNDTTVDSVAYVDTLADSAILGNQLIYTTGGVIENIAPPACTDMTLFQSRLFLIDAEDPNTLWYSKQVIESTPVEMSDLFTKYIAPTSGAEGSTGDSRAIAPMDDKLVVFKQSALSFFTGVGPDNTGAQNDFSEPTFIISTVGTINPKSVVVSPEGLMFDAENDRWILRRNLVIEYIGAGVDNSVNVPSVSALAIPNTKQIRIILTNNRILMYDYYYSQWGEFTNINAIAGCIYQRQHTYLSSQGDVYQETPGTYLDGSRPVLTSFVSSWFNLAGLQGFERAYFAYVLGQYYSPHKLAFSVAYDYNPSPSQLTTLTPDNVTPFYGEDPFYGQGDPYGGPGNIEQYRVFFDRQKCQAFQITLTEQFDASAGQSPGAGLSLSGLLLTVGMKDRRPRLAAARSFGG